MYLKKTTFNVIPFAAIMAMLVMAGCKPDLSHERRISLQNVQAMTSGSIAHFEKKHGEVFVSIVDPYGDCHIFLLEHPDVPNKDALIALKSKKDLLEKIKTEPPAGGDGKPAPQP